jgi:CheY-like chemotaxis protein
MDELGKQEKVILVVDDDVQCRDFMAYQLGKVKLSGSEVKVLFAADAQEAIEILADERQVDLLLTDYIMPGINGVALCAYVRETYPQTMRVIITGTRCHQEDVAHLVRQKAMMKCLPKHVQWMFGEFAQGAPLEPCGMCRL